jgi:hypothetical protein
MSNKIKRILCAALKECAKIAKETQSPVDDFIVKALQDMLKCGR